MTCPGEPRPSARALQRSYAQHTALAIGEPVAGPLDSPAPADGHAQVVCEADLPVRGMRITFRDMEYVVRNRANRGERSLILKRISGFYLPGEMAAVMGPSGSGKSTHLDILAGRKTVGDISGIVHFAGQRPTSAFLKRFTGYVEQFDTLLPELTVAEMLMYTAELKCPTTEGRSSKRQRVEELIDMLSLKSCRDTHIGDTLARGISGGQAKRTNVGIALITNPKVLFLDEPTSGLDSFTAHEVMKHVKAIAARGITIVATIHCPPPHTFRLFDRVLMLQQGSVVYFGLNGAPATTFFNDHYEKLRLKTEDENLAEWLVDITSEAERQGSDRFVTGYADSPLKRQNDDLLHALIKEEEADDPADDVLKALAVRTATTTPMWKGLEVMLRYRTRNNYISPYYLFGRLFDKLMCGSHPNWCQALAPRRPYFDDTRRFTFFTIAYYWHIGSDKSAENAPNVVGLLFIWAILPAWGAGPYLPALVLERPIFVREVNDGLYTPFTYLTYKMIEELSMAVAMSIVFALPTFYFCELQGSFFVVWLVWLISLADGIAFAYATAAISPTMDIANCTLLTVPTVLLFGAGYTLRRNTIPRYLLWFSYVNWLQYAWGALMVNRFEGDDVAVYGGQTMLQYYSLENVSVWAFVGYEALFVLFFLGLSWLALTVIRHQKRANIPQSSIISPG